MYILKNRVLSLFITIMLLVGGNMSLFGGVMSFFRGLFDKPIEGDLFIIPNSICRLGDFYGPVLGGLTKVGSDIISEEEMDPDTLMVEVWATSRDNPGEKQPQMGLLISSKEGALSEKFPPEWHRHNLSNQERAEKWNSLTEKEQDDLYPPMNHEELKKYWRNGVNGEEARKSGRSDNWDRHKYSKLPGRFPAYIPIKYVKGINEEGILPIEICDNTKENCKDAILRFKQGIYRYGDQRYDEKMTFEKMLSRLSVSHVRRERESLNKKLIELGISDTEEGEKRRESLNKRLIKFGVLDKEEKGK